VKDMATAHPANVESDALNAVLCAAGFKPRWLLRAIG